MPEKDVALEVNDLHTYFFNRRGVTKAVDGVSFSIREGETLGIV
jgi:ABC-type dipeptide/oligopeptide/nickel transport system ATPase component